LQDTYNSISDKRMIVDNEYMHYGLPLRRKLCIIYRGMTPYSDFIPRKITDDTIQSSKESSDFILGSLGLYSTVIIRTKDR
jgi:hypothetical protein